MATKTKQFQIGKTYSFNTYIPEILGTRVVGVKCIAIMDARNALSNGLDIISQHEKMKPHLPTGYNNDPYSMVYVKLQNGSGVTTVMAVDWINTDTLEEIIADSITVVVEDVATSDIERIRKLLLAQGYNNFSIRLTEK